MTVLELLLVITILGLLANVLIPAVLVQIIKARATQLITEFKLVENAVHQFHADNGKGPGPWFAAREHPDLAPYLRGQIRYSLPKAGMLKLFMRYSDSYPSSSLRFRSGYLLYSFEPSPLLSIIEKKFEGRTEVYWPGRMIVLVIEK